MKEIIPKAEEKLKMKSKIMNQFCQIVSRSVRKDDPSLAAFGKAWLLAELHNTKSGWYSLVLRKIGCLVHAASSLEMKDQAHILPRLSCLEGLGVQEMSAMPEDRSINYACSKGVKERQRNAG